MLGNLLETLTHFGVTLAIVVIGIMLLAVCASGTSIGRALLPRAVTDVVSKLLPKSFITDAMAKDYNNFRLDVSGNSRLKQVNVHRSADMTIAWTVDETLSVPQSGTFALICFSHNLKSDSVLVPEKVKQRVEKALTDVLISKHFQSADADSVDLWISVFGALEDEVSLDAITNSFERPDNPESQAAVQTAMSHGGGEQATQFGRGSLVLDIVDSQTTEVLWRAAAITDMLVDVNDAEKKRRTGYCNCRDAEKVPTTKRLRFPQMQTDRHVRNSMSLANAVFSAIILLPSLGQAQELSPIEAQSIAREAYIYGYPIVQSYRSMYTSAIDTKSMEFKAPFNTLKHDANVLTPNDTVLTPNADTLYSLLWIDLRKEPVVLSVPAIKDGRYYTIQLTDLFKFNFDYIGSRATGNAAGKYLIAGPDWQREAPDGITQVIRCETRFATAIYRTELRGSDDRKTVRNIQQQYSVQTLSEFAGEPKPDADSPIEFPAPAEEPSLGFFSTLNFALAFCPPQESEQELMTRFSRIGVRANAPFEAEEFNAEIQAAIKKGINEGEAMIVAANAKFKLAEVVGTREYLNGDYLLKRAVAAKAGRFTNSKEEALYQLYLSDDEGKPLDASATSYVLRFSENELPPVNAFWSITVYDSMSNTLVPNPINRYRVSSSMISTLNRDADGGLKIHVQNESPSEEMAPNWLPAPNGPFYMVMRLYWPKPEAYDGTWTPPLVWQSDATLVPGAAKPAGTEAAEEVKPSVFIDEAKPEMERPTIWGEPTEVQIVIYVIDVDDVNSADQSFAASVYYEARWKNPFLRHKGPGPMHRGVSDVWTPRLTIIGQQMVWKSFPDAVEIHPDGTVIQRQKVWGRFSQPLKLRDFPFDEQELSIHLVGAGLSEEHIKIVHLVNEAGRSSGIANNFSLPDFDVLSSSAEATPYYPDAGTEGVAGYEMKIKISRQVTYYILKVIVIMSWLPRWIDPEQSGTNIGISTSAFLTLVAYLFAIMVLLPRVSYITRMDRFILLSTLTVFAGLIHTVANTVLLNKPEKKSWLNESIEGLVSFIQSCWFLLC